MKRYAPYLYLLVIFTLSSCLSLSGRKHYSEESYFVPYTDSVIDISGKYKMNKEELYRYMNINANNFDYFVSNKHHKPYEVVGTPFRETTIDEKLTTDSTKLNFVTFNFNGKDTLQVVYRDNDFWYEVKYKGNLKKDCFEVMLQNKRYPFFPIISRFDADRIRIGRNKSNEVVIHNYSEHWGTFLFFGAHNGGDESAFILERIEE
ncbi:hypothetical protein [Dysgonomonas massiliensis]|uniref:hypothetical protein n=1 Tax=Dysgonomonas massiliensis TaxID=2040292 RepID=UPI0011AF428E|nr:hypothetical protein [Dysgonomonas massiliensis]